MTILYQPPLGSPEHYISPTPRPSPLCNQPPQEWHYEMRREAQEIIPGLFLGAFNTATNADRLAEAGITHLLCVRDARERSMVYPRFPDRFQYYTLEVKDSDDEKIISRIPPCLKYIDDALSSGGRVLAHCFTGIALAPAIVVSYLMTKFTWDFDSALAHVQAKRYCVSPLNFKNQLKEYEPIYRAMQMMQQSGPGTKRNGRAKRELEDDAEDEQEHDRRITQWPSTIRNDEDVQMA